MTSAGSLSPNSPLAIVILASVLASNPQLRVRLDGHADPRGADDYNRSLSDARMQAVKDQVTLARAFVMVLARRPSLRDRVRLVMIGDGPLRDRSMAILHGAGVADLAWLPGHRDDIPAIMQGLDCFVLPSIAEGVSNTILEAMASGLPVIATDVGANSELVDHGVTGFIVPPADEQALAAQIVDLASDAGRSAAMGRAGRAAAESRFSLQAMTSAYQSLYDSQLASRRRVQRVPLPRS